jgi:hypothetical protein
MEDASGFSFLESEKPIFASDFKQIDLNDEKNLLELEDPVLIKHMYESRKMLDETIKKNNEIVFTQTKEDLEKELINQARDVSLYISNVKKSTNIFSTNIENLIVQNNNLNKLYNGENPYGYPEISNFTKIDSIIFKKIINHINNKLSPLSNELNDANIQMVELEKKISIIITNYNLLIGKLFDFNQTLLLNNKEILLKLENAATETTATETTATETATTATETANATETTATETANATTETTNTAANENN